MGVPMARRVRASGWPLVVWARRRVAVEEAEALVAESIAAPPQPMLVPAAASWAESPQTVARQCDIVCTIVGGPGDVQGLYEAMLPAARPGTLFIDLTTAAPGTAARAQALAHQHGVHAIEAPVTGGVAGAARGTLTCFAGGEAAAVERASPLLAAFASDVVHCGGAGSGYRMKLVNQVLMVGAAMGVADAARMARAAGLHADEMLAALRGGSGASASFENYLPRMLQGTGPVTFALPLLLKDLRLAYAEAAALQVAVPLVEAAIAAVEAAIRRHGPEAGVQALAL